MYNTNSPSKLDKFTEPGHLKPYADYCRVYSGGQKIMESLKGNSTKPLKRSAPKIILKLETVNFLFF